MHVNRGLVFWGVALVTAGAVALAIQTGAIEAESAREVWQYWPVVLIVIGVHQFASERWIGVSLAHRWRNASA